MKDNNIDTKKTRYSDEELEEFKNIILEKLEKAQEDLKLLTEAYTNHSEHDTNDTSPTFKVLEEGQQVLSKEENSRLAARQERFITNLQNALIRIENKTYGICRVTGKLISKERLRAVPHATLSIDAKLKQSTPNPIN
jgi:RNA polymerase-binding transcription factor